VFHGLAFVLDSTLASKVLFFLFGRLIVTGFIIISSVIAIIFPRITVQEIVASPFVKVIRPARDYVIVIDILITTMASSLLGSLARATLELWAVR
jgi:hypothetical protein